MRSLLGLQIVLAMTQKRRWTDGSTRVVEGAHDLRKDSLRKDSHNAKETTRILGTLSPTSPDKAARAE